LFFESQDMDLENQILVLRFFSFQAHHNKLR
jgi:hypothetical protein